MRRLFRPIPIAVLCAVVALVALLAYGLASNEPDRGVEQALAAGEREPAPEVDLPRLSGGGSGSLDDYKRQGRRAQLLGLLVRALSRRVAAAPALARAPRERGDATVLGVDVQDVTGDARDFVAEYGLTYPMLRDGDGDMRETFGILGFPETFVIDRRGRIAAVAPRPGRRALHARAGRRRCCGSGREARRRCSSALAFALALPAAAARGQDCPQTTLGDIEDEVMCPICGTPLGLASRRAAGPARARLHRAPDRRLPLEGRDQARAGRPVRRVACSPCPATPATTTASRTRSST